VIFAETPLRGAYVITPEKEFDERGFFARAWCRREFGERGLETRLAQCNISFNRSRGTLRGMHYQTAPHAEAKLLRCTSGSVYAVIIDLRPTSPTFLQHYGVTLRSRDHKMLYVPEEFAVGFETLEDDTEVFYQMSEFYTPGVGHGIRWNDPTFGIEWPEPPRVMTHRDRTYPDFRPDRR
jgi:dTDP-4-dehydrorhamnose 3,5-epimerase